jgi:hypothetical protein
MVMAMKGPESIAPRAEAAPEAKAEREAAPERPAGEVQAAERPPRAVVEKAPSPERSAAPSAPEKDAYHVKVERILEDNLIDVYVELPKDVRARFKAAGEALAAQLRAMTEKKAPKPTAVLEPIRKWLKVIPGVNPFFLEQEAKIKTDKVMSLIAESGGEQLL